VCKKNTERNTEEKRGKTRESECIGKDLKAGDKEKERDKDRA